MQTIPARPDATPPVKKKRHAGLIILAILGGSLVISAISGAGDSATVDTPTSVSSDTTYEVTAENVVDAMGTSTVASFCTLYDQLGDYDLALASFTEGYGQGQDPSAEEVFDELLVRC